MTLQRRLVRPYHQQDENIKLQLGGHALWGAAAPQRDVATADDYNFAISSL